MVASHANRKLLSRTAAVAGAAAGARMLARRTLQWREPGEFLAWDGPAASGVDIGVATIDLPIRYWRTDCFMGVFAADYGAILDLLPSTRLQPVRLSGGRAAVAVVAYNYLETGVGPYGEIGISPLCTLDRTAPPVLGLAEGYRQGSAGFVAHLPVTARVAREAGRQVWGYPKFVADMAFVLSPERQSVILSEDGQEILRLEVRRAGHVALEQAPLSTFTVRDDRLIRTTIPTRGHVATTLGSGGGELAFGTHPLAHSLTELGLSTTPVATRTYLTHAAILPAGEDIGPSEKPYSGYAGTDREFGDHTIRYDDTAVRVVSQATPSQLTGQAG